MLLDAFALSISGRRANNEDSIFMSPELGLFVVADGMGGYEGGEIASAITVETIQELVRRTAGDADVTWPYWSGCRGRGPARPSSLAGP